MKKTLILFSLVFITSILYAQDVQTTNEEYLYLTKGLKRHLEEGADSKNGYTLMDAQPQVSAKLVCQKSKIVVVKR